MDSMAISTFTPDILFQVFRKLGNVTLCRMRRTCKFLDQFAEENRNRLSSRRVPGLEISLLFSQEIAHTHVIMAFTHPSVSFSLNDFDVWRQMSAMSIKFITFEQGPRPIDIDDATLARLRLLPPAERAYIWLKPSQGLKVFEAIPKAGLCQFRIEDRREDFSRYEIFKTLNQNPKRSSIRFFDSFETDYKAEGLFDQVKYFEKLDIATMTFDMKAFLKEMFSSENFGSIRGIKIDFYDGNWSGIPPIHGKAPSKLWNVHDYEDIKERVEKETYCCLSIHFTKFHDKYVIFIEFKLQEVDNHRLIIRFADEKSDIPNTIFEEIGELCNGYQMDFDVDDEEQIEKFKQWHKKRCYLIKRPYSAMGSPEYDSE